MLMRPALLTALRVATAALCAAYAERVGRPFPPGLLPDEPLRPVGPRGRLVRLQAALAAAWHRDPRLRGVDLLFGSAATRRPLIPFGRAEFLQRARNGYFVAGFAAKPLGDIKFYYMRRDGGRFALFRFTYTQSGAAKIARFLERFDMLWRTLPHETTLMAFEKDGLSAQYELTTPQRTTASDRPRLADADFSELIAAARP